MNRHRVIIKSRKVEGNLLNIYFFLRSITDRSEDVNQYLKNVSISLIDITQYQSNDWAGTKFDPSKLDLFRLEKNRMTDTDGLISTKKVEVLVDWIGENKKRVPPHKFKIIY